MKRKFYIPILGLCLCLCGCSLFSERGFLFESFVSEYCNINYSGEPEFRYNATKHNIEVRLPTETYAFYAWDGISDVWKQTTPNWEQLHERHRELSRKNGDVGFDMIIDLEVWGHSIVVWNTDNLISAITITSNANYDETHPAGVVLDDIVEITYTTHKPFIENGYKHMIEVDGVMQFDKDRAINDYGGDKVTKKLSEFQPEDAIFMEVDRFSLSFVDQPTAAQNHTFTVTVEFEHSEPYSFSFDMDFSTAE